MTVPDRQLLTNSLLAMLTAGTGRPVGDHKAPPPPAPPAVYHPYSVLYSIPGGGFLGAALVAPDADADFVYQVDSVGVRRDQTEWLADRVRRSMLARTASGAFQVSLLSPAGLKIADRLPDGGAGGVQVDGTPPHEVFSIAERFVLRVVPA